MDSFDKEIITNTFEDTQKIGEDFAQQLKPGDVVLLYGDLGSGKTTFTQGLVKGLGIKKRIISPTFVIVRTYKIATSHQPLAIRKLYHIDLYRTETENDLKGLGIEEILNDKEAIVVVEWPEKLRRMLPRKRWKIHFSYENENQRKILIASKG